MNTRRGGYLLVRLDALLVVIGARVVLASLLYPELIDTPNVDGIYIALAGFAVLPVAMLLLVQTTRD